MADILDAKQSDLPDVNDPAPIPPQPPAADDTLIVHPKEEPATPAIPPEPEPVFEKVEPPPKPRGKSKVGAVIATLMLLLLTLPLAVYFISQRNTQLTDDRSRAVSIITFRYSCVINPLTCTTTLGGTIASPTDTNCVKCLATDKPFCCKIPLPTPTIFIPPPSIIVVRSPTPGRSPTPYRSPTPVRSPTPNIPSCLRVTGQVCIPTRRCIDEPNMIDGVGSCDSTRKCCKSTRPPTPTNTGTPPSCTSIPGQQCFAMSQTCPNGNGNGRCYPESSFKCCKVPYYPSSTPKPPTNTPVGGGPTNTPVGGLQCRDKVISYSTSMTPEQCYKADRVTPDGMFQGMCAFYHCPNGCTGSCGEGDPGYWLEFGPCNSGKLSGNECGQIDTVNGENRYCIPKNGCDARIQCGTTCIQKPKPTDQPPACPSIRVFKDSQLVTDYSALVPGDLITIVVGPAASKIRINGAAFVDLTEKNTDGHWTHDVTIPTGITTFHIEVQ